MSAMTTTVETKAELEMGTSAAGRGRLGTSVLERIGWTPLVQLEDLTPRLGSDSGI